MKDSPVHVRYSIIIDRPVEAVWQVVTDIHTMPYWARGVEKILDVDPPGALALGTRVTDIGLGLKKRWPETFWVDVFEPQERIGFKWQGSYGTAYVRYQLTDCNGSTQLDGETYGDYRFPYSLILPLLRKTANQNFQATLENIRRICYGEKNFQK